MPDPSIYPGIESVLRLVCAAGAGALIGYERELHDKPAGLRTNILICFGAALFTIVSCEFLGIPNNRDRIAASIVTGIGFLGAGSIIHQRLHVIGMTTAATIWAVASIGMTFGAGAYGLGLIATLLVLFVLFGLSLVEEAWLHRRTTYNLEAQAVNVDVLLALRRTLEDHGIRITAWEVGKADGQAIANLRAKGDKLSMDRVLTEIVREPDLVMLRRW